MAGTVRTELRCPACGVLAEHELSYAGRLLVVSRCLHCGHRIERDVRARYAADLRDRVWSKPRRMARRLSRHPVGFAAGLPRTAWAKPRELVDEVRLVLGAAARVRRGDR